MFRTELRWLSNHIESVRFYIIYNALTIRFKYYFDAYFLSNRRIIII